MEKRRKGRVKREREREDEVKDEKIKKRQRIAKQKSYKREATGKYWPFE